jgi:hypothetical protein
MIRIENAARSNDISKALVEMTGAFCLEIIDKHHHADFAVK